MTELLQKLSSYNLFNYLLPGIVFVAISGTATPYTFVQKDLVVGLFVYYFIGLVISRIGSLLVEPTLKRMSVIQFADYKDFVVASQADPKIDLLSEANNMYRTLSALCLVILSLKAYACLAAMWPALERVSGVVLLLGLLALFVVSYRKQTQYVTTRIHTVQDKG